MCGGVLAQIYQKMRKYRWCFLPTVLCAVRSRLINSLSPSVVIFSAGNMMKHDLTELSRSRFSKPDGSLVISGITPLETISPNMSLIKTRSDRSRYKIATFCGVTVELCMAFLSDGREAGHDVVFSPYEGSISGK